MFWIELQQIIFFFKKGDSFQKRPKGSQMLIWGLSLANVYLANVHLANVHLANAFSSMAFLHEKI